MYKIENANFFINFTFKELIFGLKTKNFFKLYSSKSGICNMKNSCNCPAVVIDFCLREQNSSAGIVDNCLQYKKSSSGDLNNCS